MIENVLTVLRAACAFMVGWVAAILVHDWETRRERSRRRKAAARQDW